MAGWLHLLAVTSLLIAGLCAAWIALEVAAHPQQMWIMNVVWPITALYAGPLAVLAYYMVGRLSTREASQRARERGTQPPGKKKPFWQKVALGSSHCGGGCTLADLIGEWALVAFPLTLFGRPIFGAWVVDYFLALLIGIFFQYFTIAPMRNLSLGKGLWAALKADTLSLTAWQVGMYGWMALATFVLFGYEIGKTNPIFWFMMQLAMLAGFLTSYPVNWWLLRAGLKEAM